MVLNHTIQIRLTKVQYDEIASRKEAAGFGRSGLFVSVYRFRNRVFYLGLFL